jgi:TonB-dependent SusC/RagA subfamily outer membrane receptor
LTAQALKSEMLDKSCIKIDSNAGVFENRRIRMGGVRTLTGNKEPLLIVDGKKVKLTTISEINTGQIKNVEVLKSANATALYGPDGVNGAIIITTKNKETKKPNKSTPKNK